MKWEVINLETYCKNNNIKFPCDKIKYLNEKIERYYFIRNDINILHEKYFDKDKKSHKLGSNLIHLDYSYSNLFELASIIICSIFDIMGFIINTLLLKDKLKDKDISFNKISKLINQEKQYTNTKNKVNDIKNDISYLYFNAFNNTIKHRGIIKHFYKLGKHNSFINDFSLPYINSFCFNAKKYDECTANQFFEYGDNNVKIIIELGSVLNTEIIK